MNFKKGGQTMKKIIFCFVAAVIMLSAGLAQASYTYKLDIAIPNPDSIVNKSSRIGGVDFDVFGGAYNTNWTYEFGNAIPTAGNWIFESYPNGYTAVYDNYPYPLSVSTIAPLSGSGRLLTLTSDVPLTFANLGFIDYTGNYMGAMGSYYTTQGFQESPTPVSMPPSVFMLVPGLVGLIALRRKMK
jgi:hypothetical protein